MRIVAEPGVHATTCADGALLAARDGEVFHANAVTAAVWAAIAESSGDFDEVAGRIADRYGLPTEQARVDVSAMVGRLHDARLVSSS
jgi:hypothetical protein